METRVRVMIAALAVVWFGVSPVWAQGKPKGGPPMQVWVSEVTNGQMAPMSEFIGTVFYQEVSEIASELSGLAEVITFEEGQRVTKGQILVKLSSDLLEKQIKAARSTHEQVLVELQKEKADLVRIEKLFKENSIAEQRYDEIRFAVRGHEKRAAALEAQVERFELELRKKTIRAPFGGIVIKRRVDRGEWLSEGSAVATLAKDDVVDVVAELPEQIIRHVKMGMPIDIRINADRLAGEVVAVIPRGDIATRTIPVKIRTRNELSLVEGMSAVVSFPTGFRKEAMIVPRDAVIPMFGRTVVFAIENDMAKMIPVSVVGYDGLTVGILSDGLKPGMKVVVKGNERLRDGQQVSIATKKDGEA